MKNVSQLAAVVAMSMALALAPWAHAQNKGMDNVKAMDADKDGMISKSEFMKAMEKMFDDMDKGKTGKLSAADVQKSIDNISKTYGFSN